MVPLTGFCLLIIAAGLCMVRAGWLSRSRRRRRPYVVRRERRPASAGPSPRGQKSSAPDTDRVVKCAVYHLPLLPVLQRILGRKWGYIGRSVDPPRRLAEHAGKRHPRSRGRNRRKWWWLYIDHSVEPTIVWYDSERIAHRREQEEIGKLNPPFCWEGNDPRKYIGELAMTRIWTRARLDAIEEQRRAQRRVVS